MNEVFRGKKVITDLVYSKNEYPGDLAEEGGVVFDLHCTGPIGERFLIEVQRGQQTYFKERILFYSSRLISDQAPRGRRSLWGYQLSEVYVVAVMETFSLNDSPPDQYLHDIGLTYSSTGKQFYDKLGYIYIELSKFVKAESELTTDLDRWLYVLKNMSSMDKIPVYVRKPIFEKLFNIAEYSNMNKEEKMKYDASLKRKWDYAAVMDTARMEGEVRGKREVVRNLIHKLKLTNEQVADVAGVSIDFVQNVRTESLANN